MRILIRTSKWAIWARRFGSLAVPLTIIPVFLHRERLIASADFHIVEAVAMGVAALALVLALGAFARLWVTGDQGWGKAVVGLLFSVVCLAPLGVLLWQYAGNPPVSDVTTDFANPPGLVSQAVARPASPGERAAVEAAFPNARDRSYPIEAGQMFALVAALADARGWEPRAQREPQTPLAEGQVNAVATSLLGWRDEVAIRIEGNPQGAIISMRSAALHTGPDFGGNGRRIEEFLTALDERVTLSLRDIPVAPTTDPESDDTDQDSGG
jgi:hypothetical protein